MTTATLRLTTTASARQGVSLRRVMNAEWIKLRTLRSSWYVLGGAMAAMIAVGIIVAYATTRSNWAHLKLEDTTASATLQGFYLVELLVGVLGVLFVSGEYSTGMIRSTLTANPVRGSVLAAKATVLAAFLFVSSLIIFGAAALAVSIVVSGREQSIDWSDASASLLPILVSSLAMAVFALIGVAFGFILRSGAGAIAATVGLLFVLPIVANFFAFAGETWKWVLDAATYLPVAAAQSAILPDGATLEGPVPYLTLAGWVVAGMLGAWAVLRTRDA